MNITESQYINEVNRMINDQKSSINNVTIVCNSNNYCILALN